LDRSLGDSGTAREAPDTTSGSRRRLRGQLDWSLEGRGDPGDRTAGRVGCPALDRLGSSLLARSAHRPRVSGSPVTPAHSRAGCWRSAEETGERDPSASPQGWLLVHDGGVMDAAGKVVLGSHLVPLGTGLWQSRASLRSLHALAVSSSLTDTSHVRLPHGYFCLLSINDLLICFVNVRLLKESPNW
jgi:hypothetical protein